MNNVNLGGCVTFVSQSTQTKSGLKILTFGIKTKKKSKSQDDIYESFKVTAFGTVADYVEKYFEKGDFVIVNGQLSTNSYKNKNDETVREYVVVASDVESIRKTEETANEEFLSQTNNDGFIDINRSNGKAKELVDDDLPF